MADRVISELHIQIFPLWAVLPLMSIYSVQLVISVPYILELFICSFINSWHRKSGFGLIMPSILDDTKYRVIPRKINNNIALTKC